MNNKSDWDNKIINNEDLKLTPEQKEEAIKKEQHYRDLYHQIFDLNSTKKFNQLASELIKGYNKMMDIYNNDNTKDKKDMNFIIKFAFRDFFLLIFINMKQVFDNSEFLKNLHREVYLSQDYVTLDQFKSLIDYCQQQITDNGQK